MLAPRTAGPPAPEIFVPVRAGSVEREVAAVCDVYMRVGETRYVLYLAGGHPLGATLGDELERRRVAHLYVRGEDSYTYGEYLIARVRRAIADPDCTVEQQAQAVLDCAHFLIARAESALNSEAVGQLFESVNTTVDAALRRPELVDAMLRMTCHDAYTYGHSVNVAVYGTALALFAEEREDFARSVALGLSVHDLGKSRIRAAVLNATGLLDLDQWREMRRHPSYGRQILEEIGMADDPVVCNVVELHHERRNGGGYPKGLSGERIPREARICRLADVFDALTSDRPYRPASRVYEGLQVMVSEMSEEFDSELLAQFVRLFGPRDYGS